MPTPVSKNQHHNHGNRREKAPEHVIHELYALRCRQFVLQGAKYMGKKHAAHPDQDGQQMNKFEDTKSMKVGQTLRGECRQIKN